ncbi:MAG: MBL fold metallo-hydrolase [Alphaproteobacteria bacterium]|nr:MBL fold metallo-hydrolase [Alphaproteobacteria bacterium]
MFLRKAFVSVLAAVLLLSVSAVPTSAMDKKGFKVTLLGTGTPFPSMTRFGPGILIQAGGQNLLFDSGRGVTQRLFQLKMPFGKINHVFLTHLHSDHVVGIPDLWLSGWLGAPWARRKVPFAITGPEGTTNLMKGLEMAYAWDIKTRIEDQNLSKVAISTAPTDMKEGVVYNKGGVKVSAIKVNHGAKINPAFGFRIDYDGRTVVLSGDTKYTENLVKNSKGADLIIHSVASIAPKLLKKSKIMRAILSHHSEPEDTAKVFNAIKPKLAVYSHIVLYGGQKPADLMRRARKTYSGPLVVGKDLMSFVVGPNSVEMAK